MPRPAMGGGTADDMRRIRTAAGRGHATDAGGTRRCAFSCAQFHDPAWTGFGRLRVLNEHWLAPGAGPGHPRANMEELGYVVSGSLEVAGDAGDNRHGHGHGRTPTLAAGDLYWIGAGHGAGGAAAGWVAGAQGARVLQAWIQPDRVNAAPAQAWRLAGAVQAGGWECLASPDGAAGSVRIRQQATLHAGRIAPGAACTLEAVAANAYWLQVLDGAVTVDGTPLTSGDGFAMAGETASLAVIAGEAPALLLVFALPE